MGRLGSCGVPPQPPPASAAQGLVLLREPAAGGAPWPHLLLCPGGAGALHFQSAPRRASYPPGCEPHLPCARPHGAWAASPSCLHGQHLAFQAGSSAVGSTALHCLCFDEIQCGAPRLHCRFCGASWLCLALLIGSGIAWRCKARCPLRTCTSCMVSECVHEQCDV